MPSDIEPELPVSHTISDGGADFAETILPRRRAFGVLLPLTLLISACASTTALAWNSPVSHHATLTVSTNAFL